MGKAEPVIIEPIALPTIDLLSYAMNVRLWSVPVKLETPVGQVRLIASAEEASDFLLNHWPTEGGDKHLLARRACVEALAGSIPASLARKAFIEACEESGMHVVP
ncbi:DUF982 domain-containing protein [Labrys sp. LIt4]|uniref:DUF982 domain-containing protein n=1 Tax=Labrys sp. LIt4 TaxID=2821355 RepID=UPI001AE00351|nr:DUF982 domain-containing protein [Labrys sp. LIt4]